MGVSHNKEFLDFLLADADERGKVHLTVTAIAQHLRATNDEIARRCWALQKMGFLTFQERHLEGGVELIRLRIRRAFVKKVGTSAILFDMGMAEVVESHEQTRVEKLQQAAKLLEEAMEIELAILVLDAISGTKREYHYSGPRYLPGSGRKIRIVPEDEAKGIFD